MLAQNNEYIREASETVYHLSQEEQLKEQEKTINALYSELSMLRAKTSENR